MDSTFYYPIGPNKVWYLYVPQAILWIYLLGCISWAVSVFQNAQTTEHEKYVILQTYYVDLILIFLAWIFIIFFLGQVWRNKWEHRMQSRHDEF